MNTKERVDRIFSRISNYRKGTGFVHSLVAADELYGDPVGWYENSEDSAIAIFENGLAWLSANNAGKIKYSQIENAALSNGKDSDVIIVRSKEGGECQISVLGRRGQFRDSLEVLRFLDRVTADLKS